jgi:hypothetical protein
MQHDGMEDGIAEVSPFGAGSYRRELCESTYVWRLKSQDNVLFGNASFH